MAVTTESSSRAFTDPEKIKVIQDAQPSEPLEKQRKMMYFLKPYWRRLTEYEIMTVYSQPTPDWIAGGLDWGDWTQKFHGGRPSWGNEFTELRTTNWHRHRDPAKRWHPIYVKDKSEEWRYTDRYLKGYSAEGQVRSMDPYWRDEIIGNYWGAFMFNEYGLFNAHSSIVRDCLSDTIRTSVTFAAFDKVDNAQMIQLERSFLAKVVTGFEESTDAPKKIWLEEPAYQGARNFVEEIWQGTYDHMESLFTLHMLYDPLFGQLVRKEFFQRLATNNGDGLTPFFINQAQTYAHIVKDDMKDLFVRCLADDPEFSDHNRAWMQAWCDKWLPLAQKAMTDFMGMYAKVPDTAGVVDKAIIEESVTRVVSDWVEDYIKPLSLKVDAEKLKREILSGLSGVNQ